MANLKKRFISIAAAFLMLFGLTFIAVGPAEAYQIHQKCDTHGTRTWYGGYTTVVCMQIKYRKQDDGTGYILSGVWLDINRKCSSLDSPKLKKVMVLVEGSRQSPNNIAPFYSCHTYRHLGMVAKDRGTAGVAIYYELNLNNAKNYQTSFQFRMD